MLRFQARKTNEVSYHRPFLVEISYGSTLEFIGPYDYEPIS